MNGTPIWRRVTTLGLIAALALATAGVIVAVTDDASVCDDLRGRLAEIRDDLPGRGLEQVSPEEYAALEAAAPEQYRLMQEIRARDCD